MSADIVPSPVSAELGRRLRAVRKAQGLSLEQVERDSGHRWSASALGAYERGFRTVSVPGLVELAEFYDVPIGTLLGSDKPERATPPTFLFNGVNDEQPFMLAHRLHIFGAAVPTDLLVPLTLDQVRVLYRRLDTVLAEERKARHQFPDPVPGCTGVVSCSRCPAEQVQAGDGTVAPVGDAVDWCPPEARS